MATIRKLMTVLSPLDVRDYKIAAAADLPETFELPMPPVKNQKSTNSCVAHACSTLVEYFNKLQESNTNSFSTEFIYGYRPAGYYVGEGMYLRNALNTLRKRGDCRLEKLPGNNEYAQAMANVEANIDELLEVAFPNRISTYFRLNSIEEIKTALYKYGPVVVSLPWGAHTTLNKDKELENSSGEVSGYHCVVLYGWNEKGWLMQNSWGVSWGKKGHCIVPFDFTIAEAWGVTDEIIGEDEVSRPSTNWFIKVFYKIINVFYRAFFSKDFRTQ